MSRRDGDYLVADFYLNSGGLNTASSPFAVEQDQATGGKNFDYRRKGGIRKRSGHAKINSVADASLRTLGLGVWDKPGEARTVIRATQEKLQAWDVDTGASTDLVQEASGGVTALYSSSITDPVNFKMFNTPTSGSLWGASKGFDGLWGVTSATITTPNGSHAPEGSVSASFASGAGTWDSAGLYYYAFTLVKTNTGAESNAGCETSVTTTTINDEVTLDLSALTLPVLEAGGYSQLKVYRSSVSGSTGFTAGVLATTIDISGGVPASYVDTGTAEDVAVSVPRAFSLLDNSTLDLDKSYAAITTFKQRLVVCSGSSVYISDSNKPESWPLLHRINLPSGGDITAAGVISRSYPGSDSIDEFLCIFKQSELWIIEGTGELNALSLPDWSLKYIDNSGCAAQALLVGADGNLAWVSHRGIHTWDGAGKPQYISEDIEDKFERGGTLDKSKLSLGHGFFSQSRNEIIWALSDKSEGDNKYCLKLDLRQMKIRGGSKGVFTPDVTTFEASAAIAFFRSGDALEESIIFGDNSGFLYNGFSATAEAGGDLTFEYFTPYIAPGGPTTPIRVTKIVAWVLDAGPYTLNLDLWSNYRYRNEKSSRALPISPNLNQAGSKWGQFEWGQAVWGANADQIRSITFNPAPTNNSTEGDSIRLKFSQTGSTETVLLYGFSIYYTVLPTRK